MAFLVASARLADAVAAGFVLDQTKQNAPSLDRASDCRKPVSLEVHGWAKIFAVGPDD